MRTRRPSTPRTRPSNAVWNLARHSALYDTQEQVLDTPTREKGAFMNSLGDSRASMFAFDERAITYQALARLRPLAGALLARRPRQRRLPERRRRPRHPRLHRRVRRMGVARVHDDRRPRPARVAVSGRPQHLGLRRARDRSPHRPRHEPARRRRRLPRRHRRLAAEHALRLRRRDRGPHDGEHPRGRRVPPGRGDGRRARTPASRGHGPTGIGGARQRRDRHRG